MELFANPLQIILGILLLISALGVLLLRKPVHASLSFLVTLLLLAVYYFELSGQFIGVMQILVYAGAILVIFMFVIVLFQDAHQKIDNALPQSSTAVLALGGSAFLLSIAAFIKLFYPFNPIKTASHRADFGSVESLGKALYLDFVFPFEALIVLFLVAIVGAFYIGRKGD